MASKPSLSLSSSSSSSSPTSTPSSSPENPVEAPSPAPAPPRSAAAAGSVSSRLLPNGLAVIELNRPGKLNALDADCCDAVSASLLAFEKLVAGGEAARSASSVLPRALLLTGSRESARIAFCAGGDVRTIREAALARPVGGGEERELSPPPPSPSSSSSEEEERQRSGKGNNNNNNNNNNNSRPSFPLPPRAHPCERVFQAEYSMLSLLAASSLPILTLVDGVQMGLGAGLSSAALCSRKGRGGISVVTERTLWAMPEGKIGLFPDVGFLAAAPGLAEGVAANAREAAAAVSSSSSSLSPPSSLSPSRSKKKSLLFSAEAALLFGLTGARIEGGEALVAAGLASFSVRSSSSSEEGGEGGSAEALLSALARADLSGGDDAAATLFAVAASTAARAAKGPPSSSTSPSSSSSSSDSSSSLLLLEAAAEGGSLRPSLRRALDYREGAKEAACAEEKEEDGKKKRLSRALVALRAEWEALAASGCAAAKSALEAWLGKGRGDGGGGEASCPLSSALTLRLAADAERERKKEGGGSGSSSSLWSSDPAAALRRQLSREFLPAARLAVSEAFAEGVRATLVEKGKEGPRWPRWCSSLEEVEDADVEALLLSGAEEGESGLDVEGYLSRGCVLD